MGKTSVDARKHLRELSKIFSGGESVAEEIVNKIINCNKKKKYLKQSFERLISRKFIVASDGYYKSTPRGLFLFLKYAPVHEKISKWDGKWRLITFDVPVKYNSKRSQLRALLKEFDFYQLQKSVWICPLSLSEKFWRLVIEFDLEKYCKAMVVDIIEGDENLRKHFKLTS